VEKNREENGRFFLESWESQLIIWRKGLRRLKTEKLKKLMGQIEDN